MNDTEDLAYPVVLKDIVADTEALGFTMASEARTGSLLRTLVASKPAGKILELGTGTGMGTAWLLDGMDERSRLTSVEQDRRVASVAIKHLGRDPRVTFAVEDADEYLARVGDERFDLIFADTWVGKFLRVDETLQLLAKGGLYVVDDMVPQANWPEGHAEKVRDVIARLDGEEGMVVTKLTWASGLIVAAKRRPVPKTASN